MDVKLFEALRLDRHFNSSENDSKEAFEIIMLLRDLRKFCALDTYIIDANTRRNIQAKLDSMEEESKQVEEIKIVEENSEPIRWSQVKPENDEYVC